MNRSSTLSPGLEEATTPVIETVATDNSSLDFEVTATFKLSNIKQYFEDDPAVAVPPAMLITPFFGPQLRLGIAPSIVANTKGITAYLLLAESNSILRPMFIELSLTVSTDAKGSKNVYFQRCGTAKFSNDYGRRWDEVLTAEIWKAEEPLRCANAVYLLVKVVGSLSQTPTSRSPPVHNLLHETIVEAPRSGIRFTVFKRRNPVSKKLTNRRFILADLDVIKDTCGSLVLDRFISGQWKGFLTADVRSLDCEYDQVVDSEIPENDSDLEDSEDIEDIITAGLADAYSLSGAGLDGPERALSQSRLRLSEESKHAGSNDADETSAGTDSQHAELTAVESGDSYGLSSEDQMQIDGSDTPVMKAEATQTDPRAVPPQLRPDASSTCNLVVVGAAATTWEAFIFYLYTGVVEFAPLSSKGLAERDAYVNNFDAFKRPKPCSPKSMYRIAYRIAQTPLEQLALKAIVEQLDVDNILQELFSHFTSEFEEVEGRELAFFTEHCDEIMESQAFKNLMVDVATGTYPHAGKLLGKVFQIAKEATPD